MRNLLLSYRDFFELNDLFFLFSRFFTLVSERVIIMCLRVGLCEFVLPEVC